MCRGLLQQSLTLQLYNITIRLSSEKGKTMSKRKMSENSLKNLEMANPKNNFNNSEVARKAQAKATEVKREKKLLKEELMLLLAQGKTQEKISLALIEEAIKGNVKAFEVIRDTIGEKPVNKQEVSGIEGMSVIINREAVQVESNN